MAEKRFTLSKDTEWWFVEDNTIQVNEYGYRDDVTGEDKYRMLQQDLTEQETVDLLNKLNEENQELKTILGNVLIQATKDYTGNTSEIKVSVNPNSFDLIKEVMNNYGVLKGWYND